jgi:Ser/Thr protein kinase RdoA (MazF antagonist)
MTPPITSPLHDLGPVAHLVGPAAELRVVRSGHRVVLVNPARHLLVRLYPAETQVDGISRELAMCRYLHQAGLRVPRPADLGTDQPIRVGSGHWCTVWQLLDGEAGTVGDYRRLGVQLRVLHAVPPPGKAWTWSPVARIATWIDAVNTYDLPWLPTGTIPWLQRRLAEVRQSIPALDADVDQVFCHGDPHPGNLLRTANGDLLVDYEYAGVGPREWDLSEIRCHARRFGLTAADRRAFVAGYGADLLTAPGPAADRLVTVRELMLTTWAVYRTMTTGADPGQALLRVRSLRDPGQRLRWSPQ